MKILITTNGKKGLDDAVSERFARAKTFTIVYVEQNEIVPNKTGVYVNEFADLGSNAGVEAARFAVNNGVDVVVAGNIKENALTILKKQNIKVLTGHAGEKVSEAVKAYIKPKTQEKTSEKKEAMSVPAAEKPKTTTKSGKTSTIMIAGVVLFIAAVIIYMLI